MLNSLFFVGGKFFMFCRRKEFVSLFLISLFMISLVVTNTYNAESSEPVFTLVAKTVGGTIYTDYLNFLKQHLARIRINVDVIIQDWPTYLGELIAFRDFDLFTIGFTGGDADPDFSSIYSENGSLNMWGYHTSMDWDEDLGTGKNEWYLKHGTQIMPPDSNARVQHYWEWEQYLMDKICPLKPILLPDYVAASWSNLLGYSFIDGPLKSWGKMSWDGSHIGQTSTSELIIFRGAWSDLNPLFQRSPQDNQVSQAMMDYLFKYDNDLSNWPHLATDWTLLNDTHIRINLRQNIKWQTDPDGLFPGEFFDVDDVYFTLYCWKHLSIDQASYKWLEQLVKVDQYTLDIFIDSDPSTPKNEPYAPFLKMISTLILPEHYLNQTQLSDGKTPDVLHPSWYTFSTNCFGTGLFEIDYFSENVETKLTINNDCWFLDPLIDKTDMNFESRYGNFTGGLESLRIKHYPSINAALLEFEIGKLDVVSVTDLFSKQDQYELNPDFKLYSKTKDALYFYGYNLREERGPLGNRTACPGDPSMTVGLALRKAISYAINRMEINNVLHRGEYTPSYYPIYDVMGVWCNPNIIRYEYDLDKAREYMAIAGYDVDYTEPASSLKFLPAFSIICLVTSIILFLKKKQRCLGK